MRPNEKSKSSEFTYHKKDFNTDTSAYDSILNAPKKFDNTYNPNMPIMHDTVTEGNYKVTRDTRFVPIVVEHEEDEIQWTRNTSISTDAVEPKTFKEEMTSPNGHLWIISGLTEVIIFFQERHGL